MFNTIFSMKHDNRGQMLLIVVLTMVVALTVGLSAVSRTVTNLKISKQSEESQRAFQAAEAGIQKALRDSQGAAVGIGSTSFENNASFNFSFQSQGDNEMLLNGGGEIIQDKGIDVWLSEHDTYNNPYSGNLDIYWGTTNQNDCSGANKENTVPAVEILTLSGLKNNPSISKEIYDDCDARIKGTISNPDVTQTWTIKGQAFKYKASINITNGLIMKVIPIYNSTKVAIKAADGINIPAQGTTIESTGKAGDTQRKILYFESFPQIPAEIFPYSIMSQ